jgi:hypothetical protein
MPGGWIGDAEDRQLLLLDELVQLIGRNRFSPGVANRKHHRCLRFGSVFSTRRGY